VTVNAVVVLFGQDSAKMAVAPESEGLTLHVVLIGEAAGSRR
jgi:hypothetical protein